MVPFHTISDSYGSSGLLPGLSSCYWCWSLGQQSSGRMGMGNNEFRFLDWYRSCRNIDFSHFIFDSSKVENFSEPRGRSDDAFCSDLCRNFSRSSRWKVLDGMVPSSRTQREWHLAELQIASALGCFRCFDILYRVCNFLVRWARS